MKKILTMLLLILALSFMFYSCTDEDENNQVEDPITDEEIEDDEDPFDDHVHIPGEWEKVLGATCTLGGSKQIICTDCFEILDYDTIPATGHNMKDGRCQICNASYSEGLHFVSNNDGTCYLYSVGDCLDADIIIPPVSYDGDKVVAIEDYAFYGCDFINSVEIPDSVTEIGSAAFMDCTNLYGVVIGDGVTLIESHAFYGCHAMSSAVIGNGVKTIEEYAFADCIELNNLTIGNSVEVLGYEAFYGAESLEFVRIPESVAELGHRVFSNCINLTKVIFNGNSRIEKISYSAFRGCEALTSIEIPDSVTVIEESAFYECKGLEKVVIGNGVKTIEDYAFNSCESLKYITFGSSVESIGYESFYGCSALKKLDLPASLISMGKYAFGNCVKLQNISFAVGSKLEKISYSAFRNCVKLISVEIPDSVTVIEDSAFYECKGLENVIIGNGVKVIEDYAFISCESLKSVNFGNSLESIGYEAFYACHSLESLSLPASLCEIGKYAFSNCDQMTTLIFAKEIQLEKIGSSSFAGCKSIKSVIIPDSVRIIEASAFKDCYSIASLSVGDGVTEIEEYAFSGCTGIENISFGNSLEKIGYSAFYETTSLKRLDLPDSLIEISRYAFGYSGVERVTCGKNLEIIHYAAFINCKKLAIVMIDTEVKEVASGAFEKCDKLKRIYYMGTLEEWNDIDFGLNTDQLLYSPFCYSELKPASGDYWHYDENGEIRIWNLPKDVFMSEIYANDFVEKCLLDSSIGNEMVGIIKDEMWAGIAAWEAAHVVSDPTHIVDQEKGLILKKDLYKYVLFDLLTGEHAEETIMKSLDNASTEVLTTIAKAITDDGNPVSLNNLKEALSKFDIQGLKKELSPVFSKDILDKFDIIVKLADNAFEAGQAFARYYAMQTVGEGYINIVKEIAKDTSNPYDLRLAAEELVECYEDALSLELLEFENKVFWDASVEDMKDSFGKKCWDFLVKQDVSNTLAFIQFSGQLTKLFMEHLNMDEVVDSYYKLSAAVTIEKSILKIGEEINYENKNIDFLKYRNRDKGTNYMSVVGLLKKIVLLESNYSLKFFEAYNESAASKVDPDEYNKLINDIIEYKKHAQSTYDAFEQAASNEYDKYYAQ